MKTLILKIKYSVFIHFCTSWSQQGQHIYERRFHHICCLIFISCRLTYTSLSFAHRQLKYFIEIYPFNLLCITYFFSNPEKTLTSTSYSFTYTFKDYCFLKWQCRSWSMGDVDWEWTSSRVSPTNLKKTTKPLPQFLLSKMETHSINLFVIVL